MPNLDWNKTNWDGFHDWSSAGEEWSTAWGGSEAQWFGSLYPRLHRVLPAKRVLEIAPGFGRWTNFLVGACESYIGIDLSERCVAACRSRFAPISHARFIVNDGMSLIEADGSFDFVFSFDSLVHAELDVFVQYIPQIISKLTPNGVAFIHHSNLRAIPNLTSNPHCRATSVDAAQIGSLIVAHGGRVMMQEIINWGGETLNDCMTMFGHEDGLAADPIVITNPHFMNESHIVRLFQSFYSGPRFRGQAG